MTDAEKREKVIRGLESLWRCVSPVSHTCGDCPYQDNHVECIRRVVTDALALLKEQEPRVMTLEEVINAKDQTDVWLDELDCVVVAATISNWTSRVGRTNKSDKTYFYGIKHTGNVEENYLHYNYNKTWRCWSARPTEEQMRDTKWEGDSDA